MKWLNIGNKKRIESYSIMFFLLMYTSANTLFGSGLSLIPIMLYLAFRSKMFFDVKTVKKLFLAVIVILLYGVITNMLFSGKFQINFIGKNLIYATIAISAITFYKKNFVFFYEKVFFILMIVSLIFFFLQIVNYDMVFAIVKKGHDIINADESDYMLARPYYANILIYTINSPPRDIFGYRNSGFLFEPGFFSMFICLAMTFSLLKNGFRIDKKIIIYIIALITTVSTTGLLMLLFIVFFYVLNKQISKKLLLLPIAIIIAFFVVRMPIVYDKIQYQIETSSNSAFYAIQRLQRSNIEFQSIGRFAGLAYEYDLIVRHSPIFGFFNQDSTDRIEGIIASNGLAVFLKQFGFLGLIILFYLIYKTFWVVIYKENNKKYHSLITCSFFVGIFSYGVHSMLIFWIFFYYGYVNRLRLTLKLKR